MTIQTLFSVLATNSDLIDTLVTVLIILLIVVVVLAVIRRL